MYPTGPTPGGSSNEEYDLEKVYPTEMTSAPNSAPKPAATASQASQTPASGNASSSGSGSDQDADDLEMRYPTGPMPGNSGRGVSGDVNKDSASPTGNGSNDEEYHDTAEDYDKDEADLIELQYPTGPPPKTDDDSDDDRFDGETGDELVEYLERKIQGYRPLSEKDLEKLRRKQKAEGIISGISDAVRSVANLIATHHYAPNMYNGNSSMSAKAKARFDKAKAERDAEDDQHFNYVMALRRLRDADAATEYQHKRDALQDRIRLSQEARAQLKADRDAALANLRMEDAGTDRRKGGGRSGQKDRGRICGSDMESES